MNQREIRRNCYLCGHRSLMLKPGSGIPTDHCDPADLDCSAIVSCDPFVRVPKTKNVHLKKYKVVKKPPQATIGTTNKGAARMEDPDAEELGQR